MATGNSSFLRHAEHFWPKGIVEGLQSFFLQIDIAEIIIHEADEPDAVVNLIDAHGLAGWAYGFLLQGQVHAFVAVVGLRGQLQRMQTVLSKPLRLFIHTIR